MIAENQVLSKRQNAGEVTVIGFVRNFPHQTPASHPPNGRKTPSVRMDQRNFVSLQIAAMVAITVNRSVSARSVERKNSGVRRPR